MTEIKIKFSKKELERIEILKHITHNENISTDVYIKNLLNNLLYNLLYDKFENNGI